MNNLQKYKSNKEIRAAKIKSIDTDKTGNVVLVLEGPERTVVPVDEKYLEKHQPRAGGYYVLYDDGGQGYIPAQRFVDYELSKKTKGDDIKQGLDSLVDSIEGSVT